MLLFGLGKLSNCGRVVDSGRAHDDEQLTRLLSSWPAFMAATVWHFTVLQVDWRPCRICIFDWLAFELIYWRRLGILFLFLVLFCFVLFCFVFVGNSRPEEIEEKRLNPDYPLSIRIVEGRRASLLGLSDTV